MNGVAPAPVVVRTLGRRPYAATRDAMIAFTQARDAGTADEIWLLEHDPVYTLGQAGRLEHLHGTVDVPVVRTERGGQITYHGPGQLVAYLLIDLRRRDLKVRSFVELIEAAVVDALAAYNLRSTTKPGAPGVYAMVDGDLQKVAALGLKIVNGRSFHGLSLNVAMDLSAYAPIDACGYPGLVSTDLRSLGVDTDVDTAGRLVADRLTDRLQRASRASDAGDAPR